MRGSTSKYYIGALACLGLGLLWVANVYFFPLKELMHWDEIARYSLPGVKKLSFSWPRVFAPVLLTGNGVIGISVLRLIRNLTDTQTTTVFLIYKNLWFVLTLATVFWFARCVSKPEKRVATTVVMVLAFLATPMTWIQANEIMCEPMVLPFCLICFGIILRSLREQELTTQQAVLFIVSGVLFFIGSRQFFILIIGSALLSLGLFTIPNLWRWLRGAAPTWSLKLLLKLSFLSGGIFLIWACTRWEGVLYVYQDLVKLSRVQGYDWSYLMFGMTSTDKWLFGYRTLMWLHFPALLLVVYGAYSAIRRFNQLEHTQRYSVCFLCISALVFAMAYRNVPQSRYYYLPNTLLVLLMSPFIYFSLRAQFVRKAAWVRWSLLLAIGLYSVTEYMPIYQRLSCLANLQVGGLYLNDSGNCQSARTLMGLSKRESIVRMSHLEYSYYFPYARPEVPKHPKRAIQTLLSKLQPETSYRVYPWGPNYFFQATADLYYMDTFGQEPPGQLTSKEVLLSLSMPNDSPQTNSFYQATIAQESGILDQSQLIDRWESETRERKGKILLDLRTPDYTVLASLLPTSPKAVP